MQSNVLSANTIRKAMPSCMVYALVQSMTFMVDTIVAGHFLGSDAVAGVALGMAQTAALLSDGAMVRNVVLFSVLVYELVGPSLTKMSLMKAGEIAPEGKTSARNEYKLKKAE